MSRMRAYLHARNVQKKEKYFAKKRQERDQMNVEEKESELSAYVREQPSKLFSCGLFILRLQLSLTIRKENLCDRLRFLNYKTNTR